MATGSDGKNGDGDAAAGGAAGPAVSRPGWLSPSTRALAGATIAPGIAPLDATLVDGEPLRAGGEAVTDLALAATIAPPAAAGSGAAPGAAAKESAATPGGAAATGGGVADTRGSFLRTTVLPRRRAGAITAPSDSSANPRFAPLRALGEGGVGEVVLVEDHDIERKVAVKRLRPEVRGSVALERFADEVRIIGQLEHPNITPVHDVGVDTDGQHYFVMKYVEGETLESIIEKLRAGDAATAKRFTHEQRAEVFTAVLNAVAYAHARGVVHRDLKPSNIMVGPFGEVTVVDWGIAKKIGAAEQRGDGGAPANGVAPAVEQSRQDERTRTHEGHLVGTPLYMSPEQARGEVEALDARSDVFSLGLVLYELMALAHPLAKLRTVHELVAAIGGEPIDMRFIKFTFAGAGAPVEYADVVSRAVAFDPAARFQTVRELLDAMQAISDGTFAVTCPVTFGKRIAAESGHFIDRHLVLYVLVLLSAVAGAGVGIYSLVRALLHLLR